MYSSTLSLTSALDGGGCVLTPRLGRFTPSKDLLPIVQEAGWASEPVWTGPENLASTGIRSPGRPARSESLKCRLYELVKWRLFDVKVCGTYSYRRHLKN